MTRLARYALALLMTVEVMAASADDALRMDALDEPMPPLRLVSTDGSARYDSTSPADRPTLLHFWATWCVPCRRELPALAALAQSREPSVQLVLVSVDDDASAQVIEKFATEAGVDLPVYLAGRRPEGRVFWTWGVPATYLLDTHGQLRGRFLGPRDWREASTRAALGALIDKPAPPLRHATEAKKTR